MRTTIDAVPSVRAVKRVENHQLNIMSKLGLRTNIQMIRYAIE